MTQDIFGIIATVLGVATFLPYFVAIYKKTVRPHIFSWFTWGLLTGVGFLVSTANGGGSAAWIFGGESILCFIIAGYAIWHGEKLITKLDWASFVSAMIVFIFYLFTRNAIWSAALAATIDTLAFVPTYRKSFTQPFDEPISTYLLSGVGYAFSLFALDDYGTAPLIYPSTLILTNLGFAIYLAVRRRSLPRTT